MVSSVPGSARFDNWIYSPLAACHDQRSAAAVFELTAQALPPAQAPSAPASRSGTWTWWTAWSPWRPWAARPARCRSCRPKLTWLPTRRRGRRSRRPRWAAAAPVQSLGRVCAHRKGWARGAWAAQGQRQVFQTQMCPVVSHMCIDWDAVAAADWRDAASRGCTPKFAGCMHGTTGCMHGSSYPRRNSSFSAAGLEHDQLWYGIS